MVTLGNEPNTWSELEPQEGNMDEEAETCVGVRGILSTCWNANERSNPY